MANYQIIISNFHTNETSVWHTFTAQSDAIAEERFIEHVKEMKEPFGRADNSGDQVSLSKCLTTKYI